MVYWLLIIGAIFALIDFDRLTSWYWLASIFLISTMLVSGLLLDNLESMIIKRLITVIFLLPLLLRLAYIDLCCYRLPNHYVLLVLLLGLIQAKLAIWLTWQQALINVGVIFLLLKSIQHIYRYVRKQEGLGGGDVKLISALASWLNMALLMKMLLLACSWALCSSCFARFWRQKKYQSARLPFGPYLSMATWLLLMMQLSAVVH